MKGINVQAKTPTGNMVVFDVPEIKTTLANYETTEVDRIGRKFNFTPFQDRMIIHGKIELKLALMCQSFDLADQPKKLASFDAKLEVHNTNESVEDVLLVDLKSPNVFIHSNAIDRAILVYLNYRSAYQSWKDEIDRTSMQINVPKNTTVPISKERTVPTITSSSSASTTSQIPSKWFLNVTVTDFKVKMPLIVRSELKEPSQVLLLMINHIGVSGIIGDITGFKGKFNGFQLKFASDGEEYSSEIKMNCCEVKEGGIEIISETENVHDDGSVAGIWNLLIRWNMMGLDVKFDTHVGTLFSRLGNTLTTFSEENSAVEGSKTRMKHLQDKYQNQLKTVDDLRSLGATESIIAEEAQTLMDIEKEYKNEYLNLKRRGDTNGSPSDKRNIREREIELILDASITIKTGKLECYPKEALASTRELKPKPSVLGMYDFGEDRKRTSILSSDSAVTTFVLPALDVDVNYKSHGDQRANQIRRAKLSSNVIIGSMPKEMSISPLFLEYLSQTLDLIDEAQNNVEVNKHRRESFYEDPTMSEEVPVSPVASSFPVDVVVHAKVRPSTVLFSCQPKAKVECTLRVPLMNLVFSSTPSKKVDSSGLNLTCQMSDFALRVNHPFENTAKGCLHVNLESIALNFIREHQDENLLSVSVITDIGNANINYDMRRLSEILAFPKAWYNRSIARRLFLGDTKRQKPDSNQDKTSTGPKPTAAGIVVQSKTMFSIFENILPRAWEIFRPRNCRFFTINCFSFVTPTHSIRE